MKEVIMPKFGFTQEMAEIVKWLVSPGQHVEQGDPIAEVTTDKVNMEVEATATGIVDGFRFPEGAEVPVTEVICYILEKGESLPTTGAPAGAQQDTPPGLQAETPSVNIVTTRPPADGTPARSTPLARRVAGEMGVDVGQIYGSGLGGRVTRRDVESFMSAPPMIPGKTRAAPAARRLAQELEVNLQNVAGSGPGGRIQSADVAAAHAKQTKQAASAETKSLQKPVTTPSVTGQPEGLNTPVREVIPVAGMRRIIAERLQKSYQEAVHITFEIDVDATALNALRERANARLPKGANKVSLTAVIAKCLAWALEQNPRVNSWLLNSDHGQEIFTFAQVNLGIAVALDEGLIVPVVRDVTQKNVYQFSSELSELAERARQNALKPEDIAEGTFTISNLGMYGIDRFKAIINPPQVGILAVSRTKPTVVVGSDNQPTVRPVFTATLSADHRVVDGAVAARFMSDLREVLEHPEMLAL